MDKKELENYMLAQLPESFDKSEGTVVREIISAVAAGIVKAKEMDEKEIAHGVIKNLRKPLRKPQMRGLK